MSVKILTEHQLEFRCTGSSESTLVKMAHSWNRGSIINALDYSGRSPALIYRQSLVGSMGITPRLYIQSISQGPMGDVRRLSGGCPQQRGKLNYYYVYSCSFC